MTQSAQVGGFALRFGGNTLDLTTAAATFTIEIAGNENGVGDPGSPGGADGVGRSGDDEDAYDDLAEDELLAAAVDHAGGLASKAHPAMGELKRGMYGPVLEALAQPLGDLGRR